MTKNGKMTWEDAVLWLKSQKKQQSLVNDCYFDDPITKSAKRFYNSSEWAEIKKKLPSLSNGRVLDIGAGRGISSYAFAKDKWETYALEPDNSIHVGRGAIKKLVADSNISIKIISGYAENLPFKSNTFDVAYSRQLLHHTINLKKACKEIYRVLKPGGLYIASREHVISKPKDLSAFLYTHPLHYLYKGENAYTLTTYKKSLILSNLKIIKSLGPYESDINLFPQSFKSIKKEYEKRFSMKIPNFIIKLILIKKNFLDNTPGRLCTFICKK